MSFQYRGTRIPTLDDAVSHTDCLLCQLTLAHISCKLYITYLKDIRTILCPSVFCANANMVLRHIGEYFHKWFVWYMPMKHSG